MRAKMSVGVRSLSGMSIRTRHLAEELRRAEMVRRSGEAKTIAVLCELAEHYRVGELDLREHLAERRLRPVCPGPTISEFLCLELAGLLECTPLQATGRLYSALRLKHRHPTLFSAVQNLEIEPHRALTAADKCQHLDSEAAERVTAKWWPQQLGLGHSAALHRLDKLIIEDNPAAAIEHEKKQRERRFVAIWGHDHNGMNLAARLATLDARYLDAAVNQMADVLKADHPDIAKEQLRAKALGILANPAMALALLQRAAQQPLIDEPDPTDAPETGSDAQPQPAETGTSEPAPPDGSQRHDPHQCPGHLCGTITVPLSKLRPKLGIAIHLHVDAFGNLSPAARVDKAGHVTLDAVREALPGIEVTVQPVIDLNALPAEDQYRPSNQLIKAILLAFPNEMFPYSNRATAKFMDLDHTDPYRFGRTGQTRLGNLCPFSRRPHRGKTAGIWDVQQHQAGALTWTSPLGYAYEVTSEGTRRIDTGRDEWEHLDW